MVKPREKAIVQDYVNVMYNQFIVDPSTNEPKRMLDYPFSELVTKLVTFSYDSIQLVPAGRNFSCQKSSFNVSIGIRKFCNVRMQLSSEYEKIKG
jgi:hypothetical protein